MEMDLLELMNNCIWTFKICLKCGIVCVHLLEENTDRHFILCPLCGYLSQVEGNRYIYHLILPGDFKDTTYHVDSRGLVVRPEQSPQ